MKKISILGFLFISVCGFSQILKPVKWSQKIDKISETEFNLIFNATIENEWHVYSQFTPEGGPLPLEIVFKNQNQNYELVGKTVESKSNRKFNDVFGVDEIFFEKTFSLTQKIKVINQKNNVVKVNISYQVCKQSCINDDKDFTFTLPLKAVEIKLANGVQTVSETTTTEMFNNGKKEVKIKKKVTISNNVKAVEPEKDSQKSLWGIFLATVLAGLLATLTPCVFPMIPMTVSFFLKQSGSQTKGKFNAFFYGFCIIIIYVLISLPFHIFQSLSPDIFSEISTNVYLNLFFFTVFVVFAISFFGAFEITMPSSLANKADNASNSGGLLGIFFMALTLIIVSFSCTGPALGFVLGSVLSTDGGATTLTIAMLGFGIGLALPFVGFALFPNLLKNLPKSGGWLNTVKVVFGFIELALAFKFLSNADLVIQTHLLEREVFLAIWIAIFFVLALYLLGKIILPHDDAINNISVGRMLLGLLTLSFVVYMIPGLWGAPVKLISAFAPPMNYSESPNGFFSKIENENEKLILPKGAELGANNIVAFTNYDDGIAYAKFIKKPILLDFTGRACQNCRLMESNVWSNEKVLKILKNDIVLISLYCDERTVLPTSEQYISKVTGSQIETIGQKWTEFQRDKFQTNARPFYVLIDTNGKILNQPVGYTPNIETYHDWLKTGISNFKQ